METFFALLALCVGNHRSPANSPNKGQWNWALMFSLFCAWIKGWVNNREAGDLRHHRAHYDINVMHQILNEYGRMRNADDPLNAVIITSMLALNLTLLVPQHCLVWPLLSWQNNLRVAATVSAVLNAMWCCWHKLVVSKHLSSLTLKYSSFQSIWFPENFGYIVLDIYISKINVLRRMSLCDFSNWQHGFLKCLVASLMTDPGLLLTVPGDVIKLCSHPVGKVCNKT